MTPDTFARRLPFFRQGGLQGRNLYLWRADSDALRAMLANERVIWADVSTMLPDLTSDAAVRAALEGALHGLFAAHAGHREIVVLTDPGVLARYRVSLTVCYEHVNGTLMVIIVAGEIDASRLGPLPRGLRLQTGKIVEYLRGGVDSENVVEESAA